MKPYLLNSIQVICVCILLMSADGKKNASIQQGKASYYGREFEGRKTACGEIFRNADFTAAHRTMDFNTFLRVTNLKNNLSVTVRVNDRGPFIKSRDIDLSKEAFMKITDSKSHGSLTVTIEIIK